MNKIKAYLGWESVLFFITNLSILLIAKLTIYTLVISFFLGLGIITDIYSLDAESKDAVSIALLVMAFIFILTVIIKYLSLPVIVWVIHKLSKNSNIQNLLSVALTGNLTLKLKILLCALWLDCLFILLFSPVFTCHGNQGLSFLLGQEAIYGGLFGSYLFLFILHKFLPIF